MKTLFLALALAALMTSCSTLQRAFSPARDVSGGDGFDEAAARLFDPKLTAQ